MTAGSTPDRLWDPVLVQRQARQLSELAATILTRQDGAVRAPDCVEMVNRVLRSRFAPEHVGALVQQIGEASLHLSHPRYVAQQVAAPIPLAALVETVVAALNNSLSVWEMSPAGTAIDRDLMRAFKRLFGYPAKADGTTVPGGAFANLTAMLAARASLAPASWKRGGGKIAVLAGSQAHYTVSRAAGIMGLGSNAVFQIPLDELHRTDTRQTPAVFRAARNAGFRKFMLVGTCGSTPTGSCDDLKSLADVARQEGAWLHVDAAHGGGMAYSRRYRFRLKGIESADSITFDPHKMLFMPLTASTVLFRQGRHLRTCLEQHAPYLFSSAPRKLPDIGQSTIACSQRLDALKTWLTWKAYSDDLWDELTTHVCDVAQTAYDYCARSPMLEPLHKPQLNILCFRLRHSTRSAGASDRLHWRIKETLNGSGKAYISSTVLDGRRVFRIVIMNPRTRDTDVIQVMEEIEKIAAGFITKRRSADRG
ncbi:MAG: hypothetical protein LAP39_21570 [Acidobacteriia bacterium]|nr:hypothetical protein [Terriglobia bacterium]